MVGAFNRFCLLALSISLCWSLDAPVARKVRQLVIISEDTANITGKCFDEAIKETKNKLESLEDEKELELMKKIFPEFTRLSPVSQESLKSSTEFPRGEFDDDADLLIDECSLSDIQTVDGVCSSHCLLDR